MNLSFGQTAAYVILTSQLQLRNESFRSSKLPSVDTRECLGRTLIEGVYEKMIQEDYEATSSRPREAHPSSSLEAPVDPMEHRIKPMEQSNLLGSTAVNPASVLSEVAQPHGSGTTCAGRVTSQPKFPNKYGKGNTTTTSEEDTPEDHQPPAADCVPVSSPFCPQEMYSGVEATLKGSNGRAAKQVPVDPRFGGDKKLPKEYNEKPGIIGKSPLMKIKKGGAPSDGSVNLKVSFCCNRQMSRADLHIITHGVISSMS